MLYQHHKIEANSCVCVAIEGCVRAVADNQSTVDMFWADGDPEPSPWSQ